MKRINDDTMKELDELRKFKASMLIESKQNKSQEPTPTLTPQSITLSSLPSHLQQHSRSSSSSSSSSSYHQPSSSFHHLNGSSSFINSTIPPPLTSSSSTTISTSALLFENISSSSSFQSELYVTLQNLNDTLILSITQILQQLHFHIFSNLMNLLNEQQSTSVNSKRHKYLRTIEVLSNESIYPLNELNEEINNNNKNDLNSSIISSKSLTPIFNTPFENRSKLFYSTENLHHKLYPNYTFQNNNNNQCNFSTNNNSRIENSVLQNDLINNNPFLKIFKNCQIKWSKIQSIFSHIILFVSD